MFEVHRMAASCAWPPLLAAGLIMGSPLRAQHHDTTRVIELPEAVIHAGTGPGWRAMPDTVGTVLMAGKRTTIIEPSGLAADLSVNQARQVFAKVPGLHIWENDGSGVQLGIATRGLSPNRSWEFNLRQDGRDISADIFGYPEAYYTPPMDAVQRIHVVRGAGALAYGPQFGGMVDFVLKQGAADRPLAVGIRQTMGSYGLSNSYMDIGGTKGKWNYITFLQHRRADGWRENSRYGMTTAHGALRYAVNDRMRIGLSITHSAVEQQQPGGLTDAAWQADARRSLRARNWMTLPWNMGALTFSWRPEGHTLVDVRAFGLLAERNSVGFVRPIDVPDTVSRITGTHAARQVDRDSYMNAGAEMRVRRSWSWLGGVHELSVGARLYRAMNVRRQLGEGSTASDADMTVRGPFGRELDLATGNIAMHVENMFRLGPRLSLLPGVRLEHVTSRVSGSINGAGFGEVDSGERERTVPLFGLGVQIRSTTNTVIYANITEAFRPVLFSDITPPATTDLVDPGLRDANGFNVDIGMRGELGERFSFDAGFFLMRIDDRIGSRLVAGQVQRTNIGASSSRGLELFVESELIPPAGQGDRRWTCFLSYSYADARYTRWSDGMAAEDHAGHLAGNRVENVPEHILRCGSELTVGGWMISVQASAVDGVFTDAANTLAANATATVGWLPGYVVMDASTGLRIARSIALKAGVNNVLDSRYATRRSGGYPGPGVLPGMGRQFFATLSADL